MHTVLSHLLVLCLLTDFDFVLLCVVERLPREEVGEGVNNDEEPEETWQSQGRGLEEVRSREVPCGGDMAGCGDVLTCQFCSTRCTAVSLSCPAYIGSGDG